jgi:hypothetical protein
MEREVKPWFAVVTTMVTTAVPCLALFPFLLIFQGFRRSVWGRTWGFESPSRHHLPLHADSCRLLPIGAVTGRI